MRIRLQNQSSTVVTPSLEIANDADAFGRCGENATSMRRRDELGFRVIINLLSMTERNGTRRE